MSVLIRFLSFSLLTFAAIDLAALATNAMSSVKASVRKLDFGFLIIVPVRRLLLLAIFFMHSSSVRRVFAHWPKFCLLHLPQYRQYPKRTSCYIRVQNMHTLFSVFLFWVLFQFFIVSSCRYMQRASNISGRSTILLLFLNRNFCMFSMDILQNNTFFDVLQFLWKTSLVKWIYSSVTYFNVKIFFIYPFICSLSC